MICCTIIFLASLTAVWGKVYFIEDFNDGSWKKRWVSAESKFNGQHGAWNEAAGYLHTCARDMGIQIDRKAGSHSLTAKFDSAFTNKDKELVIQMSVKHAPIMGDCSSALVVLSGELAASDESAPPLITFGPDICTSGDQMTHVIFYYPPKQVSLMSNHPIIAMADRQAHLYTLVVKPGNTYEVIIDLETVQTGNLIDNFDFLQPRLFDHFRPGDLPEEEVESERYVRCNNCTHISLKMEQRSTGTVVDDIIVTDSLQEAKAYAAVTFMKKKEPNRSMCAGRAGVPLMATVNKFTGNLPPQPAKPPAHATGHPDPATEQASNDQDYSINSLNGHSIARARQV